MYYGDPLRGKSAKTDRLKPGGAPKSVLDHERSLSDAFNADCQRGQCFLLSSGQTERRNLAEVGIRSHYHTRKHSHTYRSTSRWSGVGTIATTMRTLDNVPAVRRAQLIPETKRGSLAHELFFPFSFSFKTTRRRRAPQEYPEKQLYHAPQLQKLRTRAWLLRCRRQAMAKF